MTSEPASSSSSSSPRKRSLSKFLFVLLLVLVLTGGVFGYLYSTGKIKKIGLFAPKSPKVELKTEYKNPFKKEAQYVNPFQEFKNPFDNL